MFKKHASVLVRPQQSNNVELGEDLDPSLDLPDVLRTCEHPRERNMHADRQFVHRVVDAGGGRLVDGGCGQLLPADLVLGIEVLEQHSHHFDEN